MVRYISEKQLTIEEPERSEARRSQFKTLFQQKLSADNRWVKLSQVVPWDEFASAYMSMMDSSRGRPAVSPRIVLGALIIKHMEKLDDRGVIQAIQENIYMQYSVGLKEFTVDPVFDPSLFVKIRKRVGRKVFDSLNAFLWILLLNTLISLTTPFAELSLDYSSRIAPVIQHLSDCFPDIS